MLRLKRPVPPQVSYWMVSLDEYLDPWIAAAGIGDNKKGQLFRSSKKGDKLTGRPMICSDVLYMIKRRARGAVLPYSTCCHTFRATESLPIFRTAARRNTLSVAAHQSPVITKVDDWSKDEILLDEVEH